MNKKPRFFKVSEALFDLPEWREQDKYSPFTAIHDLIRKCHDHDDDYHVTIKNSTVRVKRGEFAVAVRLLADNWGWNHSQTRRFLDKLAREGKITLRPLKNCTVIRVNQEKFGKGHIGNLWELGSSKIPVSQFEREEKWVDIRVVPRGSAQSEEQNTTENQYVLDESDAQSGAKTNATNLSVSSRSRSKERIPFSEIGFLWNEVCVSRPPVHEITKHRAEHVRARWNALKGTSEQKLDFLKKTFERIEASDFLNRRIQGKENWRGATFDWLFKYADKFNAVNEGIYDNETTKRPYNPKNLNLGIGEFIRADGKRTYGTGTIVVPDDAPPRPANGCAWDKLTNLWHH